MSMPLEKDTDVVIFCDCDEPANIILAQGNGYWRYTVSHKVFNLAHKIPYICCCYYAYTCVPSCSYMCIFHVM